MFPARKSQRLVQLSLLGLSLVATPLWSQTPTAKRHSANDAQPSATGGEAARGKYLVENVAMCGQCHTPRNPDGSLNRSQWLQGAPVIFMPMRSDVDWPFNAPRIGGTMPADDADMVKLLTTGIWTTGKPLRLPMMPFRMSEADAKSIVAYLKSLPPQD
jgi:hypothetical protein